MSKEFKCYNCNKIFTQKGNLERHQRDTSACKKNDIEIDIINCDNEIKQLILNKRDANIKVQAALLIPNTINITNTGIIHNIIINNNTIQNNIFIKINDFDKIKYKLNDEEIKYIFSQGKNSVNELIKYLHFNKDLPEFHNCYIEDIDEEYCYIYKNINNNCDTND
jgi:hypothetical protein